VRDKEQYRIDQALNILMAEGGDPDKLEALAQQASLEEIKLQIFKALDRIIEWRRMIKIYKWKIICMEKDLFIMLKSLSDEKIEELKKDTSVKEALIELCSEKGLIGLIKIWFEKKMQEGESSK